MKSKLLLALMCGIVTAEEPPSAVDPYREPAARLIGAAIMDDEGLRRLSYLTDRIGNRLSGSAALDRAIEWAAAEMKRAGLENVQVLPVKVPHWVRGRESAVMLAPLERPIVILGLGGSVATPAEGISADVVVVSNFADLDRLGRANVAGKIVLYNTPFTNYGATVAYRSSGPSRAAQLGAVAALVRSVTPHSLRTPHTGALRYDAAAPKIPAAAVTVEDAEAMQRLSDSGAPIRVRLMMEAHLEPDANSANVMGEIRGREKPDEVVVMGGHLDSWDVGAGAQDDGSGCIASLEAAALMKKLGLRPRRTVRVVFWTNEENGGAGGEAYRAWLGDKVREHVAAIEMDGGAEHPVGFGLGSGGGRRASAGAVEISEKAFARAMEIGRLLEGIQAGAITHGGGGSDIEPLMAAGTPGFGLRTIGTHYFDWHHTPADTFDKIDPHEFRLCTASMAVLSYVLAEMPERFTDLK
jgi:Zn-dependent M28 family amino/carboxypeptidase